MTFTGTRPIWTSTTAPCAPPFLANTRQLYIQSKAPHPHIGLLGRSKVVGGCVLSSAFGGGAQVERIRNDSGPTKTRWQNLRVGDIVKIERNSVSLALTF